MDRNVMDRNDVHHRSQIPRHQLYPILSQLSPLPHSAIAPLKPGINLPLNVAQPTININVNPLPPPPPPHNAGKAQCPICHSFFSKNIDMKRHIETVHEGKRTQCLNCSASFSRKSDLKRHHEAVHEGKRTACTICSTSFSRKTDLKRHIDDMR